MSSKKQQQQKQTIKNQPNFYFGEWKNGKYNGRGRLYNYHWKLKYDGMFKDGLEHGLGTSFYLSGNIEYSGKWKDGKYHGKGTLYKNAPGKNVLIEGLFRNGRIKQIALQNESNKKRMLLKSNVVGNVKWMKPKSTPDTSNFNVQLKEVDVNSFGSEVIDNKWIADQYKYWKKLDDIDKLILLVYTDYGDFLINTFLSEGVKGISISGIFRKNFDSTINPFFPLFLKKPDIVKIVYDETSDPDNPNYSFSELRKKILDEKLPMNDRYIEFKKLFNRYGKYMLEDNKLEKFMNVYKKNLNRIIDESPKLQTEMLVARGSSTKLRYDDKWTKRFISTTISSTVAKRYTSNSNNLDIYILKPNTPCIPLFSSKYDFELEILLGSGCCKYKIIRKKKMKNVQQLAQKQFSSLYTHDMIYMRYYEVSKKKKS